MRTRALAVSGISAAAVVAAMSFAGQASAGTSPSVHVSSGHSAAAAAAPSSKAPCYSDNTDWGPYGILSTATDDPAGYTSAGAVDFTVAKKCKISVVDATGVYGAGSGPAQSVTVTFYKSNKKTQLPGKVVATEPASGSFSSATYNLTIPTVKLKKGNYFVSVQATMDYAEAGGWYWELSTDLIGNPSAWENSGGAFGLCPTWELLTSCQGYDNDFMVELSN